MFVAYGTVLQELNEEAGVSIVKKVPGMVKSHVTLASYLVEDAFGSVGDISKNVISHYMGAGRMQVWLSCPYVPPEPIHYSPTLPQFQRVRKKSRKGACCAQSCTPRSARRPCSRTAFVLTLL